MEKIIVLGNGPSLRGFDFKKFDGVATLGMNAAYRYWDQINWYPTYYCCLDTRVIESHHKEIKRLIDGDKIKRFLLRDTIRTYYPDIESTGKVDIFIVDPSERSGYFCSTNPYIVTTGGYAVRYAMYLGYKNIYLLGIDCKYVEIIPEAKGITDNSNEFRLVITKTPDHNPNYFFDGYQQEGDLYHKPNVGQNVHFDVFTVLKNDINHFNFDVRVINCNKRSTLYINNVFPYEEYE